MIKEIKYKIKNQKKLKLSKAELSYIKNLTSFLPDTISLPERLWYWKNNIKEIQTCKSCGNKVKWDKSNKKYKIKCRKCTMSSDEIKEKRLKTNLKRHGVENVFQLNKIKEKSKQTRLNKYGDKNYSNRDQFKETCIKKYDGIGYQSKYIQKKCEKTNIKNYNDPYYSNRIKCELTNIKRYGVSCQFQRKSVRKSRNEKFIHENQNLLYFNNKEWLKEQYLHMSIQEIADKFNVCHKTVLNYLHKHNIPILFNSSFSSTSIEWIEYISETEGVYIQHAMNRGEYQIPETKYKVDGYCQENNTCYEFLGDFWHGNLKIYDINEINPVVNMAYGKIHNKTMTRLEKIKSLGYNVKYIWENDWELLKRNI